MRIDPQEDDPPYTNPDTERRYPDAPAPPAPRPASPPTSPTRTYSDVEQDFLRRNPGDYDRMAAALGSGGGRGGGPRPAAPAAMFGGGMPQGFGTFNDPLTQQYEQLLQAQLGLYQQQQQAMQQAATAAEARRAQTGAAVDRMSGYVNERVGRLQGPAYTGTEQEVLRTQFLDPLERDRGAAHKRAIDQIAARGMTPDSGVAQELLNMVDREFNQYRSQGQGAIATRQIEEQRSREQEAQQLLQYLAMLPDAVARGDLDFVAYVQNLIAQPGQQAAAVGDTLAELPTRRLNDALATLGVAPSGNSLGGNSSAQLLQSLQQQRYIQQQQQAGYWSGIGASFGA